jgi:hypothetical protein
LGAHLRGASHCLRPRLTSERSELVAQRCPHLREAVPAVPEVPEVRRRRRGAASPAEGGAAREKLRQGRVRNLAGAVGIERSEQPLRVRRAESLAAAAAAAAARAATSGGAIGHRQPLDERRHVVSGEVPVAVSVEPVEEPSQRRHGRHSAAAARVSVSLVVSLVVSSQRLAEAGAQRLQSAVAGAAVF